MALADGDGVQRTPGVSLRLMGVPQEQSKSHRQGGINSKQGCCLGFTELCRQ